MEHQDLLDRFTEKARALVDAAVARTEEQFPDEPFPVRPSYRRAVFRQYKELKSSLEKVWSELMADRADDEEVSLQHGYARLEKQYLREFGLRTQKREVRIVD